MLFKDRIIENKGGMVSGWLPSKDWLKLASVGVLSILLQNQVIVLLGINGIHHLPDVFHLHGFLHA